MRALHLIKTAVGASWALRQIRVLVDLGIQVEVILGESGPMSSRYEELGVRIHELPIDISKFRSLKQWRETKARFREIVAEFNPDIIHSHFVGTTLFARFALGSKSLIPRVFQVPGPLHLENAPTRSAELWSASKPDYWIATCELTRKIYLDHGVEHARLALSYYGTDIVPCPSSASALRQELALSADTAIVGMVAYIYPPKRWLGQSRGLKGHEDLIDALEIIRNRGRDVVGVFVGGAWNGSTWYEEKVKAYGAAKLESRAIFLGTRKDVTSIYPGFDLVVHPSHSENVGGAAESLLLGVPTVASNIGGFPDVVLDGQTGLLAPPRSPVELANAILFMLDNKSRADEMAKAGQNLVRSLFDVQRTGREVAEQYRRVVTHFSNTVNLGV